MHYSMTKLAIFDLDGTLIHFPFSYLFDETLRILAFLGHPEVARMDIEASFSSFEYFRVIQYELKTSWSSEEDFQAKFWAEFNWTHYPKAVTFEDTFPLLEALKKAGYELAIATARACNESELRDELEHTGLLPYFASIKTRASEKDNWKDKSLQINTILQELGVGASQAVMIGDAPSDIESSKACSLSASYGILTGGIRKEVLLGSLPTEIFSNLAELQTYLFK